MNKDIEKIDKHIQELVYNKKELKKAYDYYHCHRDSEQFAYIEENYGIGTPTSITFTPLIKKHIDVLVGEYLELDPDLQVSCKDEKTINNILQDKKLKIDAALYDYLKKQLNNVVINVFFNNKDSTVDPFIEKELIKIKEGIDKSFISDYEIAAQYLLTYFKQSRDIDLKNKLRELFTDLLITGCCYYKVKQYKDSISFEILNPLDTFIDRNINDFYLNKSLRAVSRKYLTKDQILSEYAEELSDEAIDKLEFAQERNDYTREANLVTANTVTHAIVNGEMTSTKSKTFGIIAGLEASPNVDQGNILNKLLIPVYEIEWLEYSKKEKRNIRNEGVKIGNDIYIVRSREDQVNNSSKLTDETLSINGMFFSDKNGTPFSLILSTIDLQDKYDLLIYYRDNLIATSGTVGDWIDMAHIPTALGVDFTEQFSKWIAYKKNGAALFDSSQEGSEMLNTTFNGFDDTIKYQSIQAIQVAMDKIEMQAASITGVFPEKLGGIQERDAVSNVKVGIKYSTLLTKQYFHAMDMMFKEVNYDMLNLAKIVFKKGIKGTIILGDKYSKIFTALPEHYTVTDFDLHINDSTETLQAKETIKSYSMELIKANLADPDMVVNILTARNLTELKRYINDAMAVKKEENNQIIQLQQQLEQYETNKQQLEQQLKQLDQQNKELMSKLEKLNESRLEIDRKKLELDERSQNDKRDYNNKIIDMKTKQLEIEAAQINDSNPYNDAVKAI